MRAPDRPSSLTATPGALSIRRQCALLGIACSGVYRPPSAANDNDLASTRSHDNRTALCKIRRAISGLE
jgi:putative transposase